LPTLREFVTKWGFEVDETELKKIDAGVSAVQKNLRATARAAVDVGKKLSLGVTLPFIAISAAAIKAASDSEETLSKFGTVFQDVREESEKTAKQLRDDFGLSSTKAKELLSDTGDLLSGFGFTGASALALSTEVQKLAIDLASFTNFSGGAEGASKALTKALLGERESVKLLGIAILEQDVKAKVKALEVAGRFTDETLREKRAVATLAIAVEQSKNAIGDFARTSKSFANQARILRSRLFELTRQFGEILLPIATKVVGALTDITNSFSMISPRAKTFILILGGIAATIGPLLIIVGLLTQVILGTALAMKLLGAETLKTMLTVAVGIVAVVAILTAAFLVFDDFKSFFQGEDSVFGVIVKSLDELLLSFQERFPILASIVLGFVSLIKTPIRAVVGLVRGLSAALGTLFGGGGLIESFRNFGSEFGAAFSGVKKALGVEKGPITTEDLLGIQGIRQSRPGAAGQANIAGDIGAGVGSAGDTTNNGGAIVQNINAPITVEVPPGTPPESVGPAVQSGVKEALGQQLREARRQVTGAIAN